MRRFLFSASFLLVLAACDSEKPAANPATPDPAVSAPVAEIPRAVAQPVYSVDSVTFEIRESHPVQLVIKARGMVRTGGWSNGELKPIQSFDAEQGGRTFTFVATSPRPDMMVTQAMTPIEATFVIPALPADVKKITIIAETNQLTQNLP